MSESEDRRLYPRLPGQGLVVMIGRRLFPIANISLSGLSFQGDGYSPGQRLTVRLARISALDYLVETSLTVINSEDGMVRAEFHPTLDLMKYLVAYFGEVIGVEPTYPSFRRSSAG